MEPKRNIPRRKESPVVLLLALVLLIGTLATPFVYYAPKNRLSRAVEKTAAELLDEEVLSLLGEVLWDGSFEAKGENQSLSYTATLPKSAALAQQGKSGSFRVAFQGDDLYLYSSGLGEEAFSAPRKGAALQLCDSAFADAGMPAMQMRLLRTALILGDEGFSPALETLMQTVSSCISAADPEFSAVGEEIKIGGKEHKATTYTYKSGKEGLEKALSALKRAGKDDRTKEAYTTLRGLLSAALSKNETAEAAQRFVSFLSGESEEFAAFETKLLSENSRLALTVTEYKGRIVAATVLLGGGDFVLEINANLSEKLRKDGTWSVDLQAKSGETELFSLAFGSEIEEASKSALIRTWNYSFTDAVGAFTPDGGKEAGEIIFSFGKMKKDLGLRLVFGEDTLVFRGELETYKKGRKLDFYVDRVELNGTKISEDDRYTVTLSRKGETPAWREAAKPLFPDGEERSDLTERLTARFSRFTA